MVTRYAGNPILVADPATEYYPKKVYNPSIIKHSGRYHLIFRGMGSDWVSRLMLAESSDGLHFTINPKPILAPEHPWERHGCEDPRLIYLHNRFWLTYTAYDGITARAAMASSNDLHNWHNRHLLFPGLRHSRGNKDNVEWTKSTAIISQKVNGWYYMLFGDYNVWSARSHNLEDWQTDLQPILERRPNYFDAAFVEMGPPPIRTERGWLVIYHGVDTDAANMTYRIGAALIALDNPLQVLWRSSQPIMEPEETYEKTGYVDVVDGGFATLRKSTLEDMKQLDAKHQLPHAIFCCGALLEDDTLRLYYGAADTAICTASIKLAQVFES